MERSTGRQSTQQSKSNQSSKKQSAKADEDARSIKVTTKPDGQLAVRSCGVILFRKVSAEGEAAKFEFLLMKHPNRYDLSKGHQEEGENDIHTAQREVHEETGIAPEFVSLARGFTFIETYYPKYKRFGGQTVEKTICIFAGLASAEGVSHLKLTEHSGCVWMPWTPPHTSIQKNTIDPLVLNLEKYFKKNPIDSAETWSGF